MMKSISEIRANEGNLEGATERSRNLASFYGFLTSLGVVAESVAISTSLDPGDHSTITELVQGASMPALAIATSLGVVKTVHHTLEANRYQTEQIVRQSNPAERIR